MLNLKELCVEHQTIVEKQAKLKDKWVNKAKKRVRGRKVI